MIDEDVVAWNEYPQYRKWFNKLYVADHFGYACGPSGIPVPISGEYVVRPIYNLAGMGVGASIICLDEDDINLVPAGYFWVERFFGTHYSFDYVKEKNQFVQLNCYVGTNSPDNLSIFTSWIKSPKTFTLPPSLQSLSVDKLNIEVIGDKIIEVHLRNGFDHMMKYNEILPVFKGQPNIKEGYTYVDGPADGYGKLEKPRLGYLVK